METPKKSENNENRRIFYPRRNFWGSKKIMVWKHVPKVVKRQISFQYHMSQKKKGMFVLKNPSGAPLRGGLTCASLIIKNLNIHDQLTANTPILIIWTKVWFFEKKKSKKFLLKSSMFIQNDSFSRWKLTIHTFHII